MESLQLNPFIHQASLLQCIDERDDISYFFLLGGYGCLTGDSEIRTKRGPVKLRDFKGGYIASLDNGKIVYKYARKPTTRLDSVFRVNLEGDESVSILCNSAHQLCYHDGQTYNYLPLAYLVAYSSVAAVSSFLHHLLDEEPQSIQPSDVLHYFETALDFLSCCQVCCHSYGEQLPVELASDLSELPLQDDALEHIHQKSKDAAGIEYACTRLHQFFLHLCKSHSDGHEEHLVEALHEACTSKLCLELLLEFYRVCQQSLLSSILPQLAPATEESISVINIPYLPPINIIAEKGGFVNIKSTSYSGKELVYNLYVPATHNYIADGLVHHNCGKSFTGVLCILKLYTMLKGHGGARVGVGGTSQTMLRLTLLSDLFRVLNSAHIKYHHNKVEHVVTIGDVDFIYINCSDPNNIFAYNFTAFIFDELDELPQQVAVEAFKAVQERNRVLFPNGRKSIFIGLTTTQGLRGCYQILNMLKEKGQHYIRVRGLTKNNTTLDPDYVARLYSLYSEDEQKAFLEGQFVNLTTGRVYKDFDERTCCYDPAIIRPEPADRIVVGQDLNSGFSKAVSMFERDGTIYVNKQFSFDLVGDAPSILRQNFKPHRIDWYPDASAKEIMAGYKQEIFDNHIQLHQMAVNPSVNDRLIILNKMFKTGKLKISTECKSLILALKTRQFDLSGNPEKGKGPKAPDHECDALEYGVWNIKNVQNVTQALLSLVSA